MDPKYRDLCKRYYQYYNHGQIRMKRKQTHVTNIWKKVYPGRQIECSNSSQHKIDHKIKGVNDHNGVTQEEENVT